MVLQGILAPESPDAAAETLGQSQVRSVPYAKRAMDIVATIILVVVLLPVLLGLALLVRVSSPGPVLFRQQRVGLNGRLFWFYKFRTMLHGSDHAAHRDYYRNLVAGQVDSEDGSFKLTNDPRVTPVGRVLRRLSLDELPQLFNVLKGDMSLVGPRPAIPYEVELYGSRALQRLRVHPGLTGLWQVSGRCTLTFEQMIDLDLEYISKASLAMDLLILFRTPWVALTGKGAY
jgi:lipopolysaccharide/colanic/teichoic acid biosynthesis glycosyltransferase